MRIFVISVLSIIFLSACGLFDKYPGFSKTKSGIYYQLITIGEEVAPPSPTDYITASIAYATINDSVFFKGTRTFQLTQPDYKGSIDECFLMLSAGDSAAFIINGKQFFTQTLQTKVPAFLSNNQAIKIFIKIMEVRTQAQYQRDKEEFLKWIEDFGEYEKMMLAKYLNQEKIDVEPTEDGMYFISVRPGSGKPVEMGDIVTVNYEGRFLNGKFFDSTIKRNQPFEFVFGSEMQVIPGLEEAIGRMREGEKAVVILPSDLAWGESGSSTGIIPPFTSVMYEVELLESISRNIDDSVSVSE